MTESTSTRRRGRERYGLLLGAIVTAFAIEGIAEPGEVEQILTTALLGVTLLLAFRAADAKPRLMVPAVLVVAGVVVLSVVEAVNGNIDGGATRIANALLVILAPPAIVVGVVRSLRVRQVVTLEAVFGVLCVYLLVGMLFAFVYGSVDRLGDSPFFAGGEQATIARCLYFSFTTLTTVGYGDLTAGSNLGHTLAVSEALLGQIYLITIVSLLVTNLRPRRASGGSPPAGGGGDEEQRT